jgi:MFS family permease
LKHRGRLLIAGVGIFGALSIAYALSESILLTLPVMFLMGLTTALYSTIKETLIQTLVDDAYRGRVMATNSIFWSFTPLGSLLAGALAAVFGLQAALAINGALVLLYAPLLWFATPVRNID